MMVANVAKILNDQSVRVASVQKVKISKVNVSRANSASANRVQNCRLTMLRLILLSQKRKNSFSRFEFADDIMHALQDLSLDIALRFRQKLCRQLYRAKNAFGKAQTGTGKTAAFLLQMFTKFLNEPLTEQRRRGTPRGLILAPTRELAIQIKKDADALAKYTRLRTVAVYGGMDYNKQQRFLERYVDLVVATPGRLLDFQSNRVVDLRKVEVLVIDEADRMLDMGFIPDVRKIVYATPHKERRQTLLFSATLDEDVTRLAASWMNDPIQVEIEPESVATATVEQKVYICTDDQKFTMLYNTLKRDDMKQCIIFTNRRDQAERLSDQLRNYGIDTFMLSGSVPQKRRLRILKISRRAENRFWLQLMLLVAGFTLTQFRTL